MWKFISLSVILIVTQAADIRDLYRDGDWILVAIYPAPHYSIPAYCTRYSFSKNPENVRCTYSDGSSATQVQVDFKNATGDLLDRSSTVMKVADDISQVTPALNLTCECNDEENQLVTVVRFVEDDYLIIYQNLKFEPNGADQNQAGLFARDIMSQRKLNKVMTSIDELKDRRGAVTCTTEIYEGLNRNENEIL